MVTSATDGCSGQCASICCSTRAVVDLPTATEPARPITNGVRGGCGSAEERLLRAVQGAGALGVHAEQPGQRQVDLLHLVEVELVAEAADPVDLLGRERLLGGGAERGPGVAVELDVRAATRRCSSRRQPCAASCQWPTPGPAPAAAAGRGRRRR